MKLPFPSRQTTPLIPLMIAGYLIAALAGVSLMVQREAPVEQPPVCVAPSGPVDAPEPQAIHRRASSHPIVGLWQRTPAHGDGDQIEFYYFHGNGHGIYRYGRVGLTNTHSFRYSATGDKLTLTFRKTGEHHGEIGFAMRSDADKLWLELDRDPRFEGQPQRYFRVEREGHAQVCAPQLGESEAAEVGPAALGGRLWGEEIRYKTGGMGFAIYQLQAQTIDGRGVGWFHRGDYDEWTTEALTYRQRGEHLVLHFLLAGDAVDTEIALSQPRDGEARQLTLDVDPRDFWHRHTYLDMGPTFAGTKASAGARAGDVLAQTGGPGAFVCSR